ncbi:MAG TPA: fatty acid oxidation complex subunit alpha FadJ [Gemmatimonadaceae bacterium]|nr:fatty acid oxidation complex subunit alpha FadJ [Gemmatimonadaceae bacterium]
MTVTTPARGVDVAGKSGAMSIEVEDGVAIITMDLPNEPVNKLNRAVKDDFIDLMRRLDGDPSIQAAVLISGKADTFIAGADIEEFLEVKTAEDAERLSLDGQSLLDRIEQLRTPVVAAIHGACLGGGLETAMACAWRIGTDYPKTVLALPEVMLGLIPGAGGTQRLPALVGLRNALDMILTGRNVRAKKALQMGLLDELVHPSILRETAVKRAREIGRGEKKRSVGRRELTMADLALEKNPAGRAIVFRQAREKVRKQTQGNYPAPPAAIEAVAAGYSLGREGGLSEEARLFGQMAVTAESRELIFLFFATSSLKKDTGVTGPAPSPREVRRMGVLGTGFMGAGIAAVSAMQGIAVRFKDVDHDRVAKGLKSVHEVLSDRLRKRQITRTQFDDQMALVGGTVDYSGFRGVDLTIEAVFEDLALKHRVLKEAEAEMPARAVYASNTSSIPISRIAEASKRPERVLGMHFFSPVHKMPLLEIIVTPITSPEVTVTAVALGKRLGKHVIVVNDAPGFYTTRILAAYMNEAGRLLDEGASIEAVDRALLEFGFPVGPITLLDEVGIDVGGKIAGVLADAFGERFASSESMQRVITAGRTGRKGGKGFFLYGKDGKKGGVDQSIYEFLPTGTARADVHPEEIQDRTVLAMVNEAVRCLEEGVLRSPRDGDVGAVFGLGFPPFRGGLFRYVDVESPEMVIRRLEALNSRFAPRFVPAALLLEMAERRRRFYPLEGRPV